ncbi:MAG: hypothetical protein PUB26_01195, partial [Mycoplasmataceae bacterium]|nr:hypothetical protein [Mycoplasmataceae bacterium]
VPLSAPINLASISLVIILFSLILFLHCFLSLTTSLFFKPTVVMLPKKTRWWCQQHYLKKFTSSTHSNISCLYFFTKLFLCTNLKINLFIACDI